MGDLSDLLSQTFLIYCFSFHRLWIMKQKLLKSAISFQHHSSQETK